MQSAIYSLIPQQKLHDILHTLCVCIELPVQLIDEAGSLLDAHGLETDYCKLLKRNVFTHGECFHVHLKAGQRAQALGESYIFSCHANLNHIAFPLLNSGALLGSIIVGPFLMDTPDSTLVSDISKKHSLSPTLLLELYDELQTLKIIQPARVSTISKLIDYLLSPLFPAERQELRQNQEKLYQQSRINETIQLYKSQGVSKAEGYPYEKEKELLIKVKTGDVQAAKGVLNDLLGYVLFCEGGQMDIMKNRALELTTLLSRVAIEGGAVTDRVFRLNNRFLSVLYEINDFETLCYQLQEIVVSFVDALLLPASGGNPSIAAAISYIAKHYPEPLTLETVATQVKLSPTYFSSQFHKATGIGFKAYLSRVRVEESKRLLTATDYSLMDIAIAMGFADQSYYSKIFKKYTGLSPKQYR